MLCQMESESSQDVWFFQLVVCFFFATIVRIHDLSALNFKRHLQDYVQAVFIIGCIAIGDVAMREMSSANAGLWYLESKMQPEVVTLQFSKSISKSLMKTMYRNVDKTSLSGFC